VQRDAAEAETLLAAGKHGEAAAVFRQIGQLERAEAIYERIWDFASAAEVARERGDRPAAIRLLLDAKRPGDAARELAAMLHGVGGARGEPPELLRAAEVYEKRRHFAEAGQLREALGQLDEAAAAFERAQLFLDAARLQETLSRGREAGLLYEKVLTGEPAPPDAARAHLRLGALLTSFERPEDAVRHLQKAVGLGSQIDDSALLAEAQRRLAVALAALGYRDAAAGLLDALRAAHPDDDLPLTVDDLVRLDRRASQPSSGARLGGRYAIISLLGSGGMGRVYLARDSLSGRNVAVKVVSVPIDGRDTRFGVGYARFVREAQIVSSLHHPHIVGVVAFHEELGLLAMEYMPRGTLADRLPKPLSTGAVRTLAVQIAAGLEAAHAHGVIHRDLKPANIFFGAGGEAKLGDFGVAHLQDLGATQTAGFIGTLAYMSPEQISGAPLSFATDVYALGVTLFQALTGRLPFRGPDFVAQHLGETPPPPSSLRVGLDPAWDALIATALQKDPKARFPTLEAFRRAVEAAPLDGVAAAGLELVVEESAPAPKIDRYALDAVVGESPRGTVHYGSDRRLGRPVIVERLRADFVASEAGQAHMKWLRAVARAGGPRLQRLLALEKLDSGDLQLVYEGIAGRPTPLTALSLAQRTAVVGALAPLHAEGVTHGSLTDAILLDDLGPVVLIAGRAPGALTVAEEHRLLGNRA
jgi:serine/threonine-protein kinase